MRTMPTWNNSGYRRSNTELRSISDMSEGVGCVCGNQDNTATQEILAMVYSPWQSFVKVYDPATALSNGTIFEELNKPFCPCSR